MKGLTFGNDENEEIEETDKPEVETNSEYTDKLFDIITSNFQPDCTLKTQLEEWINQSFFLAMPYTMRANFNGPSGTLRRCLTIIDYMNALNVSWDAQVNQKDLLTLVLLKYLSISGVSGQPKMIQKVGKGINIRKITWGNNPKHDSSGVNISNLYIELFKNNIFVGEEVIHALSDGICKQTNYKLSFLLGMAETYVDKFVK